MTREELAAALRKADAAGNTEDARRLAGAIRQLDARMSARPIQSAEPAPTPQPEATPWGDGQAFDDMYARKPQTDPTLSPLRPEARTLTAGQPMRMKPPPAPRGPVMSPKQIRATQPERDEARRERMAREERALFNAASPGLAFRDTGAQGTVELNTDGGDIGRGVMASPIHAQRALVGAAEATLNTPADLASVAAVPFAMGFDPASQGIVANLEFARDEASVADAMDRFGQRYEQGGFRDMQEKIDAGPRFDFSAAKIPVPQELESFSGALAEGFLQYLAARGALGKFMPGGKTMSQFAKDVGATGIGYSGSSPRAADMLDPESMGMMSEYVRWLKTQPGDTQGIGRFKNMAEDATINLLAMGLLRGGQATTNALTPQALTPTNAGGATLRQPAPQMPPVAPATAATQPQQPPVTSTAPPTVTAPPVPPTPPNAPAVTAGAPQPGQVPPVGVMTPVPTLGPAEQAFNNLPMKTRESMLNAFQSAGVEPARAKAMIGELNNLPDGQNTMYALEIMRRNGLTDADIDGVLIAMGREFATESPRPAGRVFNREQDSARQIMNDQVRTQINSEGRSITDVAERNFGPGVVPAREALDLELDQLSNAYETILSTKRSPTGRLRSPAKKDAVYKAREDLTNALVSPEVMQTIPQDVKLQIMMQASDDMRRLKFTPDELGLILQGDGAVLAPLFNGYGALSWSPELWSHLARQYPTQAAHSLQSALRKAADEAFRRGDATAARYYKRLRGESGKGGLLDMLERAVPKYKETRIRFGDASSAKEALDILERFKAAAASEGDVAKIIKDLEDLPQRHREMAEQQITSIVRQELARKVESPRLAELGQTVAQTPNLTSLSRQDFLKALEDVFGPRGKELADAIRAARARTDTLTGISPKYNSRTEVNRQDVQNAPALYEAPGSLEGGIIDQGVKRLGTVAGGAALIPGGQGAAIALGAATAVQAALNAARRGKRLSNAERNELVNFLFKSRTAGDAAPPVATRGPSAGDYAQAIGRDAAIGAGVGAVADGDPLNNDPMTLFGGAVGGAVGYGRARLRNARSLIKPPPAPRGAGRRNPPPAGPRVQPPPAAPRNLSGQAASRSGGSRPVQAGFGFGPKPLPMDEPSRMQRAREQGFDVDTPLYHGTDKNFDSFDRTRTGLGHYFAKDKTFADQFGDNVIPAYVRGNFTDITSFGAWANQVDMARLSSELGVPASTLRSELRRIEKKRGSDVPMFALLESEAIAPLLMDKKGLAGIDFMDLRNGGADWNRVVFDPKNIRRTDAAFDPSETGSSKLLAGVGTPSAAPGLAGAGVGGAMGYMAPADSEDERLRNAFTSAAATGLGAQYLAGKMRGGKGGAGAKARPAGRFRAPDQQTFAGVNAKTADKLALARAQNMEAEGASRDDIWDATGWFKGVDGKWRFEIDDSGAKIGSEAALVFNGGRPYPSTMQNVMEHPELYAAYPDMATDAGMIARRSSAAGVYEPELKSATAIAPDLENARSIMLHEAGGHGVQEREGFARGGSIESFTQQKEAQLARDAMYWRKEIAGKRKQMPQADWIAVENALIDDYKKSGIMDWLPSREARDLAHDRISNPDAQLEEIVKVYGLDRNVSVNSPREMYRRTAGEVEARNVQTRDAMRLRGEKPGRPWETQDVPDDQQIVRFGGGKAESRPKPPPAQNGFGAGGKKSAKGPMMSGKVISELERAKKTLPPEVRNKLAANAAKPPALRVSAAEATGDDPSIYALAAPFQRSRKPFAADWPSANAVEKGVREGMARVEAQAGKPPPLDEAGEAVRLSERQRRAAKADAQTTANKLNPYANEAAGIPDKPLPKRVATREEEATKLAIASREMLAKHRLTANEYEQAAAYANARKAEIANALLTGRATPPGRPGPTSSGVLPGSAGQSLPPRQMKPVSQREAEEMAELLFKREAAQLLDDVLSGRVTPRNRSAEHAVMLYMAGGGAGAAGVAAVFADLQNTKGDNAKPEPAPKPNYTDPGNPNYVWDWEAMKQGRNKAMENLQIMLNELPKNAKGRGGGYSLTQDGRYGSSGSNTDRAVKDWLYVNGFDPNGPFTEEHMKLLEQQVQEAHRQGKSRSTRRATKAAPYRGSLGASPTP